MQRGKMKCPVTTAAFNTLFSGDKYIPGLTVSRKKQVCSGKLTRRRIMSKNQNTFYALIIFFLFVFSVTDAGALTATSVGGGKGAPPAGQNQVTKSSQFVKRIANNVLYLENKKSYDLTGVKVIDLTGTKRVSQNKKLAELMFVNGELKGGHFTLTGYP